MNSQIISLIFNPSPVMLLLNKKKALNPIISTAILLCIAIGILLATLAWINGLPTSNMYTEELEMTSCRWSPNCKYLDITLFNNTTKSVELKSFTIDSKPAIVVYVSGSNQIEKKEKAIIRVTNTFSPNETCQLTIQTTRGNKFIYTATE